MTANQLLPPNNSPGWQRSASRRRLVRDGLAFCGDAASRSWALYSVFTGLLIVACFIISNVFSVLDRHRALPNVPTGFVQRISIIGGWTWIAVLAGDLSRMEETQEGSCVISVARR